MKKVLFTLCAVVCSVFVASAQFKLKPFEFNVKYRGEVSVGGAFSGTLNVKDVTSLGSELSRPYIETVHGVMISDYVFVGAGLGLQYYAGNVSEGNNGSKWNTLTIPLFVDLKGFLPINDNWKPFVNLGLGGSVVACSDLNYKDDSAETKLHGGFYCDFGAGVEYKRWSLGIGLQHQRAAIEAIVDEYSAKTDCDFNAFYVKLGVSF